MINQIIDISSAALSGMLNARDSKKAFYFDTITSIEVESELKPLYIFGTVNPDTNHSHVISVLNPKKVLLEKLIAGGAHDVFILRKGFLNKCDAALNIHFTHYDKVELYSNTKYKATKMRPAEHIKININ